MNTLWRLLERFLRGAFVSGLLRRCGINPRHYWLLMDLFGELSERRELFSQLGRDGMSLKKASWMFYALSALMALPFVLMKLPLPTYFVAFLAISAFLLLSMLLSETSNSLINPVEGLVLAHQPIDGATYTAAKLTHLLRILIYLVPGLNVIPALAGLLLPGCPWYYPLLHLSAAFAVGLVVALSCCALFGWLIRFVPPARLKAVGFAAEMAPWLFYMLGQFSRDLWKKLHVPRWLPTDPGTLKMLAVAFGILAVAMVVLGIRALSGDYLVRVAAIAHGGSGVKSRVRRSWLSGIVAHWGSGPGARAGFEYLSRMMLRDWQFRRQMLPLIPISLMPIVAAFHGIRTSPFSGKFTELHLFPHSFGVAFYLICKVMVYGQDHKGAWLFLLAPAGAFRGFVRGVYSRLSMLLAVPHVILLATLAWYWGIRDAALFTAFSMAVGAVYLSLELRAIDGLPFSKQPEATQNFMTLPLVFGAAILIAIAVGLQLLIFRSPVTVVAATVVLSVTAWFVTRASLDAFEVAVRFNLGILSSESKGLYQEVEI